MLGREPRSGHELLMAYAGILARHQSERRRVARMIPQLSATSIRLAMRWAGDEMASGPGLPGRCWSSCSAMPSQRHGAEPIWPRRT